MTTPGEKVSVDQLDSPSPGLIAQVKGRLTYKRYKFAKICVNQASQLGYANLQKTTTYQDIVEANKSSEYHNLDHVVTIKIYYNDNGVFRANKWQTCHYSPYTRAGWKMYIEPTGSNLEITDIFINQVVEVHK